MAAAYIPRMATELDHTFSTDKPIDESYASILDLERLVPAVEGGSVTGKESDDKVNAEILMRMGAMSMKLIGTVEVVEKDDAAHRAMLRVRSRESGGTGHANADVTFQLKDGGVELPEGAEPDLKDAMGAHQRPEADT